MRFHDGAAGTSGEGGDIGVRAGTGGAALKIDRGQEVGEGLAVGGLGLITRAAAAAMSRFSFCAVSISAGNSSALKFTHQLASGQIGACLSTTGAVKAVGTSPGRSRGWDWGWCNRLPQGKHADGQDRGTSLSSNALQQIEAGLAPVGAPYYRRVAMHANMAISLLVTRAWTVNLCRGGRECATILAGLPGKASGEA